MEVLQKLPYSDHLVHLIGRCEEWIPKSLTQRAVLVGVTAGLVVYLITKKRYRLPPGPRGWPLLGNMLDFRNELIYKKLIEWEAIYGPVITFSVGPVTMVALNTTDVVYEALVKRQADFAGRPQAYSTLLLSDGGKSIAFGDYSPTWKLHRKLATKALRYYMGGTRLEEGLERSLANGIELMKQQKGPFNPHKAISSIVFNILNNISFDFTCDVNDKYFTDVLGILDSFNEEFGNGLVEDFIPPLRLFPTKKLRRFKRMIVHFTDYMNANIDKHRKTFSKDNIRDFCDAMLLAQEEAREEEDPELLSQITDAHVTQTVIDIFAAGIDTSRYTLMWCLLYLTVYPDIQSKLHQEIDQALGSRRFPKMSDRSNLPYTDAILHEVMRISSITPLAIPHTSTCDTKIGDYDIPKGTVVVINQYALHHDPKNWEDPEVFRPERFLDEDGKMAPKPDSWLPFSAGRRVCLGESVAKPELQLLLAGIMRHFKFSPPPGKTLDCGSKGGSFININKDYEILAEARI